MGPDLHNHQRPGRRHQEIAQRFAITTAAVSLVRSVRSVRPVRLVRPFPPAPVAVRSVRFVRSEKSMGVLRGRPASSGCAATRARIPSATTATATLQKEWHSVRECGIGPAPRHSRAEGVLSIDMIPLKNPLRRAGSATNLSEFLRNSSVCDHSLSCGRGFSAES
jgi:hypothetical protein